MYLAAMVLDSADLEKISTSVESFVGKPWQPIRDTREKGGGVGYGTLQINTT